MKSGRIITIAALHKRDAYIAQEFCKRLKRALDSPFFYREQLYKHDVFAYNNTIPNLIGKSINGGINMLVKDIMTPTVVTVTQEDTAIEAANLMKVNNIGAVPVTCGSNVCGMLTDRDIVLRCVAVGKTPDECKVSEVMTGSAACVTPTQSVTDAITLMASEQVRRLPVLENGELTGIISLADIARIRKSPEVANALCEISMP